MATVRSLSIPKPKSHGRISFTRLVVFSGGALSSILPPPMAEIDIFPYPARGVQCWFRSLVVQFIVKGQHHARGKSHNGPANSSQKPTRPGAGPAAELPSQHTRMGGVTSVADRQSWLRNSLAATAVPRRLRHVGPGRAA
jgi:hypothetical protein